MNNEKKSCSKFDLTTTIKTLGVFDTEYFPIEVLIDYYKGGVFRNDR